MKPDWVRAFGIITIALLLVCFWAWVIGSAVHIVREQKARIAHTEKLEKDIGETMYDYEHRNYTEEEIDARHEKMMNEWLDKNGVKI